jgi:hydrogenase maturation protease
VKPALVIGVGNRYREDDAAGLIAASQLGREAGVPVELLDNAGDGTMLFDVWEQADTVVLIDAMRSGAPAGTVRRVDAGTADGPAGGPMLGASTHGINVAEAVALARTLRRLPRRLIVIGVEGARFDAGEGLSPEVRRALDEVVRAGLEALGEMRRT